VAKFFPWFRLGLGHGNCLDHGTGSEVSKADRSIPAADGQDRPPGVNREGRGPLAANVENEHPVEAIDFPDLGVPMVGRGDPTTIRADRNRGDRLVVDGHDDRRTSRIK
jgi:hypothetical protein